MEMTRRMWPPPRLETCVPSSACIEGTSARIHSTAVRMLGEEEADDATQDVFIRAWQRLGQFRGDSAFGTWLFRLGRQRDAFTPRGRRDPARAPRR